MPWLHVVPCGVILIPSWLGPLLAMQTTVVQELTFEPTSMTVGHGFVAAGGQNSQVRRAPARVAHFLVGLHRQEASIQQQLQPVPAHSTGSSNREPAGATPLPVPALAATALGAAAAGRVEHAGGDSTALKP